jgi:hypothetical protein
MQRRLVEFLGEHLDREVQIEHQLDGVPLADARRVHEDVVVAPAQHAEQPGMVGEHRVDGGAVGAP